MGGLGIPMSTILKLQNEYYVPDTIFIFHIILHVLMYRIIPIYKPLVHDHMGHLHYSWRLNPVELQSLYNTFS